MFENSFGQDGYRVRFEWGLTGGQAIADGASIVAIVDVLSFTTTVTVAVDRHATVLPYRWRDSSAAEFAARQEAVLAAPRSEAGPDELSLSPASVRHAPELRRMVLPSPNGSTIAHTLAGTASDVLAVSLRNATATAAWTTSRLETDPSSWVAVVAAGERWPDNSLRPAVEDLWGAGAYIAALAEFGVNTVSPEAAAAVTAYGQRAADLPEALHECAGGRELAAMGHREDIDVAASLDVNDAVPLLTEGGFRRSSE